MFTRPGTAYGYVTVFSHQHASGVIELATGNGPCFWVFAAVVKRALSWSPLGFPLRDRTWRSGKPPFLPNLVMSVTVRNG